MRQWGGAQRGQPWASKGMELGSPGLTGKSFPCNTFFEPYQFAIAVDIRQYLEDITSVAKGFLSLGLEPHHSVCILGFNSPEWLLIIISIILIIIINITINTITMMVRFISHIAGMVAGGLSTGIYTTNSPEAVATSSPI